MRIPLDRIHAHPANPNVMSEEQLETLARNIAREGRYPPAVVRPHPELEGQYEMLNGDKRRIIAGRLGHTDLLCYVWPCDDATALVLLATLNRLHGEDVPAKRAELLADLASLMPVSELALLLPEDASRIEELLALLDLDTERLLADLTAASERASGGLRSISFAVTAEDEQLIEEAVQLAAQDLEGANRRGRALAAIARAYLGEEVA